ncbi:MAG: DNA polymerase III subunit gamma/tau [Nitrospirota bacterium]
MEYQVSARKYRPGTFESVIGQPHVVQTLVNAITTKRIAHAFLFSGTRGVGKTTVARILAKALNCERGPTAAPCDVCPNCQEIAQGTSVDVIEIDGASNTGVDDVREIRENVKFTPFRGQYRVYIIDEVHMLSNSAFNALLKTLEEPPAHVVFIFATTEIHKIPATILSRCQHYNFRRIPRTEIIQRLRHVAAEEGLQVEDRSLAAIARSSEGSMRDALSLLDQAVAFGGKAIRHGDLEVLLGAVPQEHVRAMIAAIVAQDSPAAVRVVAELLDQGHDLRAYCADLVEHVRNLLVAAVVPAGEQAQGLQGLIDLPPEEIRQIAADAGSFSPEQLQELFRLFSQAEDSLRLSSQPRFVLEVAAVRATRLLRHAGTAPSASAITGPARPAASSPAATPQKPGGPPAARQAAPASAPMQGQPQEKAREVPFGAKPAGTTNPPASKTEFVAGTKPAPHPAAAPNPAPARAGLGEAPPAVTRPPAAGPPKDSKPIVKAPSQAAVQKAEPPVSLQWEQVVERMEHQHPSLAPFMAQGTFLPVQGSQVTIGYPRTASVAFARMQREDSLRTVAAICSELAGRPVQIRVVELTDGQAAGPSLAQARAARERDQKQALLERTKSHPLVRQALSTFGGELADVRHVSSRKESTE